MSDYTEKRKQLRARGLERLVGGAQSALGLFTEPDARRVLGMDTSHWTGIVDWQAARSSGIRFTIIKFMDGKLRSRFAEQNYRGAIEAGVLVGAYQWLRHHDEASPGGQAREFAAMLRDYPVQIRPAVDFEWSPAGRLLNAGLDDLYGFVEPFAEAHGALPMLYTAAGYWRQYGSTDAYWSRLPLWQAQYRCSRPDALRPWTAWTFWQFTETGEGARFGVPPEGERACDLNYWCGTLRELIAWCGLENANATERR